jgi:hypothetical protein
MLSGILASPGTWEWPGETTLASRTSEGSMAGKDSRPGIVSPSVSKLRSN